MLPLAQRSLEKLIAVVDKELVRIGEPSLFNPSIQESTGTRTHFLRLSKDNFTYLVSSYAVEEIRSLGKLWWRGSVVQCF